ncbi:hypothetical protein GOV10_03050 [Candidatus Woesearchaeota archaeon]|nr:hypothetical protein [Candidatus Woesearchaeota archaeon]
MADEKSIDDTCDEVLLNPRDEVGPTFEDVVKYTLTEDGSINLAKMQELEGRYGYNGGQGCDVQYGPCSCGAWHK